MFSRYVGRMRKSISCIAAVVAVLLASGRARAAETGSLDDLLNDVLPPSITGREAPRGGPLIGKNAPIRKTPEDPVDADLLPKLGQNEPLRPLDEALESQTVVKKKVVKKTVTTVPATEKKLYWDEATQSLKDGQPAKRFVKEEVVNIVESKAGGGSSVAAAAAEAEPPKNTDVSGLDIMGVRLEMTEGMAERILARQGFVRVRASLGDTDPLLATELRTLCLARGHKVAAQQRQCARQADPRKPEEIVFVRDTRPSMLRENIGREVISIGFSEVDYGRKAWRIAWLERGDASQGDTREGLYLKATRTSAFTARIDSRYGEPDEVGKDGALIWGGLDGAPQLVAYLSGSARDAHLVLSAPAVKKQDQAVQRARALGMQQARSEQAFSF
ncbi:hypothetical protein FACS1894186_3660 [Alphaproteobacteria bacterium]|nr:hypothetical protein FACS1894186_3660 [Alphaproteobacteria bacterium]